MLFNKRITSVCTILSSLLLSIARRFQDKKSKQYKPIKEKQQGFSLFEVLCVLFILTLLASFTWHSSAVRFFRQSPYEQTNEAQNQLADGLLFARQYAVQSQQSIELCGGVANKSTTENTHVTDEACNGDWSSGWFIVQGNELKRQHFFQASTAVRWSGFPQNKSYIRFHANGHTDYQNGTFIVCFADWSSRITLNQSGRFYLETAKQASTMETTSC